MWLLAWLVLGAFVGHFGCRRYDGPRPICLLMSALLGPVGAWLIQQALTPTGAPSVTTSRPSPPQKQQSSNWHGYLAVVGESHYQEALRALRRELREEGHPVDDLWFQATLRPEPENQFDTNAVAVYDSGGNKIGYLGRGAAKQYHRRLTVLGEISCLAELRGGTRGRRSIGVVLDFAVADATLKAIALPKRNTRPSRTRDNTEPPVVDE